MSDLGGGKTTFTRGLVRGAGSSDHVSSPTFKICNTYKSKKLTIYHFDFYRLQDPGLIAHELAEAIEDPGAIIVIEWAGVVKNVLADQEIIMINISRTGENERLIKLRHPQTVNHINLSGENK